ncbi:7TM diverse intracellular signaling domain-containing protein [Microscilla marina]
MYILEDSSNSLSFKQITSSKYHNYFIPYNEFQKKSPRLQRERVYWAKLTLYNQSSRNHWILYAAKGANIQLYYPDNNGHYSKKLNGRLVPQSLRDISKHIVEFKYKFRLFLPVQKKITIYIRLKGVMYTPRYTLKLRSPQAYLHEESTLNIIQGVFQGALWIILLYNIILFLVVKDKTYLYYTTYIFAYSVYYLGYYDFFSEYPVLQTFIGVASSQSTMIFYFLFMKLFVDAKRLIPRWNKVIHYWMIIKVSIDCCLLLYISLTLNLADAEIYLLIIILIDTSLFILTLIFLLRTRNVLARYFVTGSFFLILGWALSSMGFLIHVKVGFNINYFSQAGLFLELVLFSVGLGYRERKNEQDKRLAQEENARILREQNVTLERKVKERTKEITEKNEELQLQKEEILTQRDSLQERGEELQFAYNQITDSVRYAQTIQNAILPFEPKIKQIFEEYFIIYQPKDIVSGDFYWFNTIKGENFTKTVVAVIDCTGHGVPGAFMSMIGNTLLNETINEKHIFDPAKVMTLLHQKIRSDLRQAETNNSDGMDMSLCVIEPLAAQKFKVIFSGAKRPLYYVQEGEFNQLKADRFSIGGEVYEDERTRVFTNQELMLAKGDALYMMTDGFGDTPDAERRRFGSRNIKKMISHYAHLSMEEQQIAFEATLAKHQGSQDARDDVTMLGLRL